MAIFRAAADGNDRVVAVSKQAGKDADKPAVASDMSVAVQPAGRYVALAAVLFAGGLVVGLYLLGDRHPGLTRLPTVAQGTSVFAILYIYAQAIERVLVPVSWVGGGFLNGTTKKSVKQHQQAAALNARTDAAGAQAAADAAHDADQYRANLTATTFGAASLLAFVAAGYSGALLMDIAGIRVSGWLDVLVTGLAVAGGTKPLHDLISNVSSSSAAKSTA